ncbi:hypothetical protein HZY62_16305 [Maribacter polysiphoniae]|uniref:Uncharacterized protein n=1 Tax=Maribacter polysiphoniae TaxID=429344 RepID=A0A316DUE6_9FLAO|nr:hypothetical protein [Maribacter polysiphoniae]MBD1262166.1 hypothetical protein [Maribacter polysiphoniae]PWK21575.1 hypothetical protein LX92_03726 [Maribacter polysiphoniae]
MLFKKFISKKVGNVFSEFTALQEHMDFGSKKENRTLVDSQFTCNFGHSMSLFNFFEDINALALAKRTFIWELKSKINSNSILSDVSEEGQDILENYFWTYKIKLHLPDYCRASRTFLNPYVVRSQFPPLLTKKSFNISITTQPL